MAVCFNVATWYALSSVLVPLAVGSSVLRLTGEPDPIAEGDELSLSCSRTTDNSPPLFAVFWYRNTKAMFHTVQGIGLINTSNCSEYNEISGRITVDADKQIHKVTLQINSSLDNGSVWKCNADAYYSNNLTVEVLITTTGPILGDTTTAASESLEGISDANRPTPVASISATQCIESGTDQALIVIGFAGWAATIILIVAILWWRVRGSPEQSTNASKSDPDLSVWVCETSGSDVDNAYACTSSEVISKTSKSDVTGIRGSVGNINRATDTTDLGVDDEYTSTDAITETCGSDVTNEYASSEVITGDSRSDDHYEYTNGCGQCNEDGQYSVVCTFDTTLHADKDKEDDPYLEPVPDDLQTIAEEYVTATFDSNDRIPVANK